jgi:hypothetical protein
MDTIDHARAEIADRLTPSNRRDAETQLPRLHAQALRIARRALGQQGEITAAAGLPAECPYVLAQLLDEAWYPNDRGKSSGRV